MEGWRGGGVEEGGGGLGWREEGSGVEPEVEGWRAIPLV